LVAATSGQCFCEELALPAFAETQALVQAKRIVLILDQAGWHKSRELVIPEGLRLIFLPPYSPKLQLSEPLWPLSNEGIANRCFQTLHELESAQMHRCLTLLNQPEKVRAITSLYVNIEASPLDTGPEPGVN